MDGVRGIGISGGNGCCSFVLFGHEGLDVTHRIVDLIDRHRHKT